MRIKKGHFLRKTKIKIIFPKYCDKCDDLVVGEYMWKYPRDYYDVYICNTCAPTRNDAIKLMRFPYRRK